MRTAYVHRTESKKRKEELSYIGEKKNQNEKQSIFDDGKAHIIRS